MVLQHTIIQWTVLYSHRQTAPTQCISSITVMVFLSVLYLMILSISTSQIRWVMFLVLLMQMETRLRNIPMMIGVSFFLWTQTRKILQLQNQTHSVIVVITMIMKQVITISSQDIMMLISVGLSMRIHLSLIWQQKIYLNQ